MVTRLGRWLFPALLGPVLAAWVMLVFLASGADRDAWIVGLIVATWLGGMQGIVQVLTDATLLRLGLRLLPMGTRGWLMGLGAPVVTGIAWVILWPRGRIEPSMTLGFSLMCATALVLRLLFSPRFSGRRA